MYIYYVLLTYCLYGKIVIVDQQTLIVDCYDAKLGHNSMVSIARDLSLNNEL